MALLLSLSVPLYSEAVYEITESELTELETTLTEQRTTIARLQTTLDEQHATLSRLSTTIERQQSLLSQQWTAIDELRTSFEEYESAARWSAIRAGVIGAGVGAGLTAVVFAILR
ncbi:MAG: hypothetical protein LAT68_14245 [Cyclobacteriaceae bacterium]|nr:hypothetical protein [Cyclobacteriaceae bacterium]